MKTVTREDLALELSDKLGITRQESRMLVGGLVRIMAETLAEGETIKLSGFGTFHTVTRAARKGRNPRTGETVPIPARKKIAFKASTLMKSALNKKPSSRTRKKPPKP